MAEASWGDAASPDINWRMSAALENVPRGQDELAEVTSLEGAVRAWLGLDPSHQQNATLTPEHALVIDGVSMNQLEGEGIGALAERLPGSSQVAADDGSGLPDAS